MNRSCWPVCHSRFSSTTDSLPPALTPAQSASNRVSVVHPGTSAQPFILPIRVSVRLDGTRQYLQTRMIRKKLILLGLPTEKGASGCGPGFRSLRTLDPNGESPEPRSWFVFPKDSGPRPSCPYNASILDVQTFHIWGDLRPTPRSLYVRLPRHSGFKS